MNGRERDPFDDYEDEDEFLTFDARDEDNGSSRGPLILGGAVVLLILFAIVAWTLMSGRPPQSPPEIVAATEVAEDQAAVDLANPDPSVLDLDTAPPGLEMEPLEGAQDPLLAADETAAPVPAAAPAQPARATVPAPRPSPPPPAANPAPVAAPVRQAAAPAPRPAPPPAARPAPAKQVAEAAPRPAPSPAPAATAAPAPAQTAATGAFQAQLGSFQTRAAAETQLARYRADGLSGPVSVVSANLGARGTWYRIRATGFDNRAEAVEFCGKATAAGAPCIATSN